MPPSRPRQPERRYPQCEPLADTLSRLRRSIEGRTGAPEFPTGLELLDAGMGCARQNLITIAGRPGQGKSTLAGQIAFEMARRGTRVAYVSLEMSRDTVLERMFCAAHHVSGFELLLGQFDADRQAAFDAFSTEVANFPLWILDDYCFTESELYTLIEHLAFRPDVLILDHLQHIQAADRRSAYENLTEYLRYLKELARRHNFLVMVLSQISREGDAMPSLTTLKGTGGIEEMSDQVYLLHSDKDFALDTDLANYTVHLAKNRYGPTGSFRVYFRPETYRFFADVNDAKNPNHHTRSTL